MAFQRSSNTDPDTALVATFRHHALKNEAKSTQAGRPIYDDMEVCEIRFPGSRTVSVFPATAFSHWHNNQHTGEQTPVTYAERFQHQYQQFKGQHTQTKTGTPLAHVPFLTEARRAELRALNIYTAEQLAHIDGQELKNLGQNGRDLKTKAQEYIEASKEAAPTSQLVAELEALRARNSVLEEDAKLLMQDKTPGDVADADFNDMNLEQLREYITTNSGHAPHGSIGRKTLIRMAADVQQKVPASG
jgi:hypothetical protein